MCIEKNKTSLQIGKVENQKGDIKLNNWTCKGIRKRRGEITSGRKRLKNGVGIAPSVYTPTIKAYFDLFDQDEICLAMISAYKYCKEDEIVLTFRGTRTRTSRRKH